ncbi:YCF48-related protein [Paenibacillus piri]|nr:YCF48-related protein [Paenibacillus piri]
MRKKWTVLLSAVVAAALFGGSAYSAGGIKLIVNGNLITPEVPPQIIEGNTMVPIRAVSEALGAKVNWNASEQTVTVDLPDRSSQQRQIELLQSAIAPSSAQAAVQTWADAVKSRNGAVQYAVLSPALQGQTVKQYEELGWVTGTSSPWVESYQLSAGVKSDAGINYDVQFQLKTSSGDAGVEKAKVTAGSLDGKWFITGLQAADGSGGLNGITVVPSGSGHTPAAQALTNAAGIQMMSNGAGWAWGDEGEQPVLLKTEDNGARWSQVSLDGVNLSQISLAKVYFNDARNGWISWSDEKAMYIAGTTDGGGQWKVQTIEGLHHPVQFTFADSQHGWLITAGDAAMMHSQKTVYRTEDSGASWKVVSDTGDGSAANTGLPALGSITGITFRTTNDGFAAMDNPVSPELLFFRTSNGGQSWNAAALPIPERLQGKVEFSSLSAPVFSGDQKRDGIMTVRFGSGSGHTLVTYTTHDGGITWNGHELPASIALNSQMQTAFADAAHGWLLNGSVLYSTGNGGVSWNQVATDDVFGQSVGNDPAIRGFTFDRQHGLLVVGDHDPKSARVIETNDGGSNWKPLQLQAQ